MRDGRFKTGATRYDSADWRERRRLFLTKNGFCIDCEAEGISTEATEVDHIVPHRGNVGKFQDWNNLAPRCKSHHSRKTAKETLNRR